MSRPRNPDLEQRILQIALQHLSREGYSRMSIDTVAEEAGVSKPTVYRRWSGKADLATAAVRSLQLNEPPVETGSTEGDLRGVLENFHKNLLRPNGMALVGTVLAEEGHTPELLQLFRERLVAPRRTRLASILERAKQRGELKEGVVIGAAVNMLVGAFYAHYLASADIPETYAADVVRIVWLGIST